MPSLDVFLPDTEQRLLLCSLHFEANDFPVPGFACLGHHVGRHGLAPIGVHSATRHNIHMYPYVLFTVIHHQKLHPCAVP